MKSGSWSSFRAAAELPDREDEPQPRSMPESPKPGERFALEHHPNSWTVYDWVPGECRSCLGVGNILEEGDPERKCLDCRGTGSDHEEPEEIARWMNEADARLLVFGKDLLTACKESLEAVDECYKATGHFKVAETSDQRQRILAAIAKAEGK